VLSPPIKDDLLGSFNLYVPYQSRSQGGMLRHRLQIATGAGD
jgi:hypothetical protein